MSKDREHFESWRKPHSVFNGERYVLPETDACIGQAKMDQAAWEAWQAARQQAPAEQEPVAWMLEGAVGGSALEFQQDDLIDSQRRYGGCMVPLYAAPVDQSELVAAIQRTIDGVEIPASLTPSKAEYFKAGARAAAHAVNAALAKHGEKAND